MSCVVLWVDIETAQLKHTLAEGRLNVIAIVPLRHRPSVVTERSTIHSMRMRLQSFVANSDTLDVCVVVLVTAVLTDRNKTTRHR